ncbi:hypothetical protein ACFE04_031949 [Oxalis oulophora]
MGMYLPSLEGMDRNRVYGFLIAAILAFLSICEAASVFEPISNSHRSAALALFASPSFQSLEETYEALRTFQVLGIKEKPVGTSTCDSVGETFVSSSSSSKDLFYALKVNSILSCNVDRTTFEGVISRSQAAVKGASSLLDFYYSVGSLVLVKDQASKADLYLSDAEGVFTSIKALSQIDGKWRYSSENPQSSTFAAGIALETLAGVVSLASSEIDQSMIGTTKNDILKLFDSIEKYDDGAFYFNEKVIDAHEYQGPLSTTASVVRGLTAFGAIASGSLNLPGDKILGLSKFFLGIGIPGDNKDLFNQVDSLANLESNRVSIPLILSLPTTVLSLTKKDQLKVTVSTVLSSKAPALSVKLVRAYSSASKATSIIESQELKFDLESGVHVLNAIPNRFDVGKYIFIFEIVLQDADQSKIYATGGQTQVPIYVTGVVKINKAAIAVLDGDLGSVETKKQLDLDGENSVSLSANHLQKLRLSFELNTPLDQAFKPHQANLKLTHESKVEHTFVVGSSGKQFEIDFLGLVEKFFYLSGRYEIQLTVGDAVMENSFLQALGHVELDLPEPPEKAPRPPTPSVDPLSRYGPKAEIRHIFRTAEKLPPQELSLTFLGVTLLPFIGFLVVLLLMGVNLKNFPTSAVPATFAFLFHLGIGAVLLLYVLFWLKQLVLLFLTSCLLLLTVGSLHNFENACTIGSYPDVRWSQNSIPPGITIVKRLFARVEEKWRKLPEVYIETEISSLQSQLPIQILANQLVRLRQHNANLLASRAQVKGIATHTQAMHTQTSVAAGMKGAIKAMAAMNEQMDPVKQVKNIMEFQKQGTQLDEVLDNDEAEEETEDLTNQALADVVMYILLVLTAHANMPSFVKEYWMKLALMLPHSCTSAPKNKLGGKKAEDARSSVVDELEKWLAVRIKCLILVSMRWLKLFAEHDSWIISNCVQIWLVGQYSCRVSRFQTVNVYQQIHVL